VGASVKQFKPGDEVFGAARGAFAEYVCTRESKIAMKPANVTFEQAASANIAGLTALQGLRDKGKIQPGNKLLVNGAAGGVGTFAVQIGKALGAEVTGVCSTRNVDLVRSIGADEVIDYTRQDFTKSDPTNNQRYDVILDCVGNHSFSACRSILSHHGRFIGIGAPHDLSLLGLLAPMIKDLVLSVFTSQKTVMFMAKSSQDDLTLIGELIATGKVKPVIDRSYSLRETAHAMRHVEAGHARGKVVITLDGTS
jgi:NADPH:quinone reductase-like Zn-dependent oxidoreductase